MSGRGPFRRELADLFTGDLAHARDKLVVGDDARPFVPAADLLEGPLLDDVLSRFGELHAGGDPRAVASLWSQWYLGTLVVPSVAAGLLLDRVLPLALEEMDVALDDETARPVAFRPPHGGRRDPEADAFERFEPLVRRHLAPLVEALAARGGPGRRALWGNAGRYLQWTLDEIEGMPGGPDAAASGRRLLDEPTDADGRDNPLHDTVVHVEAAGGRRTRRRVCCLRFLLPGVEGCGDLCPLPEVRDASGGTS